VSTTKTSIPYRPAPVPPKTTSPSCMLISGTSRQRREGVVHRVHRPAGGVCGHGGEQREEKIPNRTSFPSMFPPAGSTPRA